MAIDFQPLDQDEGRPIDTTSSNEIDFQEEESPNSSQYLPESGYNLAKKAIGINRVPTDTLRDIYTGLGESGQNIASTFTGGRSPRVDIEQILGSKGGNPLVKGISQYLPFALAGGPGLIGQLLAGGAYGATQTQPEEGNLFGILPQGKFVGAIKNALMNSILHGGFKAFESLRPSKLFIGNLPQEEIVANQKAAGETPTNLADVMGSPFLKRQYENVLSKLPFSGANTKLQQAGQSVEQKGKDILSEALGENNPENATDQIHESLMENFKSHRESKNKLYDEFNQEAEKQFLDLPLSNFSTKAKEYRDAIRSSNILKFEPDMKKIFSKLGPYENPVKKIPGNKNTKNEAGENLIGEPLTTHVYPTAKEANLLKGKLNHYAELYRSSPNPSDRHLAGIFGELSSALKSDIKGAVDKSGNEALKASYKNAEENYAKNFSPFLDKEIYKFLGGKADPDTIVQAFLKTSKSSDRSKSIAKIIERLPNHQKNLVGYSYLARSLDNEGNLNPAKLSTLINNLGKNQLKVLFPNPLMRRNLTDYIRLYKMNTKGVNIMQNPATGQQNLDILPALLTHAGTAIGGGMLGGLPGALAGIAVPGMLSRPVVNMLTSPNVRKSLINAIIENKPWNKNIIPALQAGERGVSNNE